MTIDVTITWHYFFGYVTYFLCRTKYKIATWKPSGIVKTDPVAQPTVL